MATKRCCTCGVEKPLSDYNKESQQKDGHARTCKPCRSENRRKLREAEPERFNTYATKYRKANKEKYADWQYKRRHGMSRQELLDYLQSEGEVCKICLTDTPSSKGWVIDHDHSCCGKYNTCAKCRRGVLCSQCNAMLGFAKDDIEILTRAVSYLNNHRGGK